MTTGLTFAALAATAVAIIWFARRTTDRAGFVQLLTIGLLFFIFGFVTWLNGPLITFVKLALETGDLAAFLVPMAFYLSYVVFALPGAAVLRRTGMKRGMAVGLMVMALGSATFGHFTTARVFSGMLAGLFTIGAGLALLQTAANPYVAIIGPIDTAANRIAFMGICNKFAGVLAPLVFGALVLHGLDDFASRVAAAPAAEQKAALLDAFAAQVYWPYLLMAAGLALLALWIAGANLPDVAPADANTSEIVTVPGSEPAHPVSAAGIKAHPHLWLGVISLFLYVGVEVLAGDAIGVYGQGFGLPLDQTRLFTSYTLAAMLAGYVAGLAVIPRFVSQERYLALSGLLGALLALAAYLTTGLTSVAFIASLGFANAMMWPAIFPLAIRGLGRHTEVGSALLIMAIAGGALIPYAFALLKEVMDFQLAYLVLAVPCYLYIAYYGFRGARMASTPAVAAA